MKPKLWLISYDISDNRARYRVERLLAAYGERFQFSVFTCRITAAGLRALRARVAEILDAKNDSVRYYPICTWCEAAANRRGVDLAEPVPAYWIV